MPGMWKRLAGFPRRAVEVAKHFDLKEPAADWEANAALREALFGNAAQARQRAAAALAIAPGKDVQAMAALTLAIAGDAARARALADDLAKRFSADTMVKSHWLPADVPRHIQRGSGGDYGGRSHWPRAADCKQKRCGARFRRRFWGAWRAVFQNPPQGSPPRAKTNPFSPN